MTKLSGRFRWTLFALYIVFVLMSAVVIAQALL